MRLRQSLAAVAEVTPERFEDLRRNIDAAWVLQALEATGTATLRRRRLPAEQVIWLVIGMALYRNRSIHDVVTKLDLALPGSGASLTVAPSSVVEARGRVGAEPLEWLFTISAEHWAHASARAHRWRGLALYGADGTTLRVPDSPENAAHFGYAKSVRGQSGYPMVRGVALMALRSHLLAAVAFGPYQTSEIAYAVDLWPALPNDSLTIVDRGFLSARILLPLARDGANRHWLTRSKKNQRWRVLKRLGPRDAIIEMNVSSEARRQDPGLPKVWVARAVTYQRKGFRSQTLLT
ncbi:MAG: IS4 family transposase, partial [Nitrospirota bacterium]